MFQRMVVGGVSAGFVAGLIAALLHFCFIQQPLLWGERYESGEVVHFADAGSDMPAGAEHDHAVSNSGEAPEAQGGDEAGHDEAGHDHGSAGAPSDWQRNILTVLFTALIYVSYGLLMMVGFRIAELRGRVVTAGQGVVWGLAGFVAFQMAPAMGLAPELPGTIAAEFQLRQAWWLGTVAATILALVLIALVRSPLAVVAGLVLLAVPHVIGAPQLEEFWGVAPPELAAEFAARALGVGLVAWCVLGWLGARLWSRVG